MTVSTTEQTGRLLVFDPSIRRRGPTRPVNRLDDAGQCYELAIDALLDALDDADAHLLDQLDEAVARMLSAPRHPSLRGD